MTKSISSKELLKPAKTQGELMSYRQGYATGLAFGKRHLEILRSQNARLVATLDRCANECERAGNVIGRENSPLVAGCLLDSAKDARALLAEIAREEKS